MATRHLVDKVVPEVVQIVRQQQLPQWQLLLKLLRQGLVVVGVIVALCLDLMLMVIQVLGLQWAIKVAKVTRNGTVRTAPCEMGAARRPA